MVRAVADVFAIAAVGFVNGTAWQVVTAGSRDLRDLPNSYRSASRAGDSALPEWREAMREPGLSPLLHDGRTVPADASALEVCDEY